MKYELLTTSRFRKQLRKLDPSVQRSIIQWIRHNLGEIESNPYFQGKALSGNLSSYWRYRIGDYRLITEIDDGKLIIIAISVGHRKDIYSKINR